MGFELHITCSKDIDKLKIDFSDGTSVVTESEPKVTESPKENPQERGTFERKDHFLDTDFDDIPVAQDIIEKPVIEQKDRPLKVAEELQNLDI